ncbi:ATP-binding cassette domain-containing protein [Streptomyces albogriseolus]|uniref:ATP-binding cassette domain-containing protein n=1 Tax=Streptomyces albogriseolus TaxID=1887 RepID=UPI003F541588
MPQRGRTPSGCPAPRRDTRTSAHVRSRRLAATPAHRELAAYWYGPRISGAPVRLAAPAATLLAALLADDLGRWATGAPTWGDSRRGADCDGWTCARESTAHLDNPGDAELAAALRQESRTTIFIAHRPATIRRADRIAVPEEGLITEEGTWEDLTGSPGSALNRILGNTTPPEHGSSPREPDE